MVAQSPEWLDLDRNLLRALTELEKQECRRCGGDLSVELTDKPPYEDDGDGHFHRYRRLWCRGCVDRIRYDRVTLRENERAEGSALDEYPAAQIILSERLPIPD